MTKLLLLILLTATSCEHEVSGKYQQFSRQEILQEYVRNAVEYTIDTRTGLCFALTRDLAVVDCRLVKHLINGLEK